MSRCEVMLTPSLGSGMRTEQGTCGFQPSSTARAAWALRTASRLSPWIHRSAARLASVCENPSGLLFLFVSCLGRGSSWCAMSGSTPLARMLILPVAGLRAVSTSHAPVAWWVASAMACCSSGLSSPGSCWSLLVTSLASPPRRVCALVWCWCPALPFLEAGLRRLQSHGFGYGKSTLVLLL